MHSKINHRHPDSIVSAKVAIVEDNTAIREQWTRLIKSATRLEWVGAFDCAEDALRQLPALHPDVVLMDIELPGISGVECTARLRMVIPKARIIIVTIYKDSNRIFKALQAGANGYLLKAAGGDELLRSINDVMQGGAPMTGSIARKVIESFQRPTVSADEEATLSEREEEILAWLARGFSNKEIGERLGISANTVGVHVQHIYKKLHVRSRVEAAAKCPGAGVARY